MSPLSLAEFSTELHPEPLLRRIVLASGTVMLGAGLMVIAAMSATAAVRGLVALAWLLLACRQLWAQARHNALVRRIRIYADGSVEFAVAGGHWHPATLASGSIVLERLAWLRLDVGNAAPSGELLAGNSRKNKDWRRLQMIWRHLGRAA